MELKGKVAVITGAGSGIGKRTALLFAQEGCRVVAVSRTKEEIDETVREIESNGGDGLSIEADVSRASDVERIYRETEKHFGQLDIIFAHAGVNGVWAPIDELDVAEWAQTIQINLAGTFHTVKFGVPLLKKTGGGSIIITASVNGTRVFSNGGASAYSSSKAGQMAFMKMMALELAKDRIRVNAICPGEIETEIDDNTQPRHVEKAQEPQEFPEGRIPLTDGKPGRPEQVAQLVLFLASDRSDHITGTPIWIDGGESLLQG